MRSAAALAARLHPSIAAHAGGKRGKSAQAAGRVSAALSALSTHLHRTKVLTQWSSSDDAAASGEGERGGGRDPAGDRLMQQVKKNAYYIRIPAIHSLSNPRAGC